MKIFYIAAAAAALFFCFWLGAQGGGSTQGFEPSRYALLAAEMNVSDVINSDGSNMQKCVFKMDTRTGEVWMLQAAVNGPQDPTVRSAVWARVANSGTFFPNGPQGNN